MSDWLARIHNVFILSLLLPFVYGCNSSGGGASASGPVGSLFGYIGEGNIPPPGGGGIIGEDALAQLHNPEPATMVLIGGGVLAMGYLRKRTNSRQK